MPKYTTADGSMNISDDKSTIGLFGDKSIPAQNEGMFLNFRFTSVRIAHSIIHGIHRRG
jgi:hypothetical protein